MATLEAYSRLLGAYDYYVRGEKHVVWDIAWTTKKVDTGDSGEGTSSSQE